MTTTRTALWMGLSWLTSVQALYHISHKPTDYRMAGNVRTIDANMTIRDVSMDWIEVDYELDDVPLIEWSILQYTWGSEDGQTLCPPSMFQRSERKMYSCRIEELTPCTEYDLNYFGLITNVSVQYTSELRGVRTTANETIPPGNLTCKASAPGALTLEWIDPFPADCKAVFVVSWEGHALWDDGLSASKNDTTSDSFYTVSDGIPEADYSFDVAVWFQGEYPGAMSSIECTTLAEVSGAPQNVSLTPAPYDVTVNWAAPAQANGVISHYDVLAAWANGSITKLSTEGPTSEAVLPGLAPCLTYQVTVAAVNGAGPGAASDLVEATTLGDDDVNPYIWLGCYNETQTVSVMWRDVLTNCLPSSYSLSYSALVAWDESKNIPLKNATLEEGLAFRVPEEDYVPGAQYSFELSTGTRNGSCDAKSNDETSSQPVITLADAGISFIYLTWEPPTAANGVIDGYELRYAVWEGSATEKTIPIDAVNKYNLTEEVFACSAYHLALAAHNGAGVGEEDTKDAQTLRADLSGIKCGAASDSSVLVSWTVAPPNCGRNGTFLSWEGQSEWDQYIVKDSILLEDQVDTNPLTDLYPFTNYNICVTLTEEWAEESCCDATTRQGVPSAPENVTASSTFSSISLTWEQPESWNGVPLNYVVVCPSADLTEEVAVNTTELTIDDLREVTQYSIEVQACNEEQCSNSFKKEVSTAKRPSTHSDTGLIVGLTLGFAAIIALVIAFVVVRSRRRNRLEDQTESEKVEPETGFSPGEILSEASSIASSSGITISKF